MSTVRIFSDQIGSDSYEVWVTNGVLQYVIDGVIQYDMQSVNDFMTAAAKAINKPNSSDGSIIESNGSISDNALENYQDGTLSYDPSGTSPSISLRDDDTEVRITNSGVGGSYRVDFGTGSNAQDEAAAFLDFANNLLGGATKTDVETLTGIQIGDFTRKITVSERDDDITQIKFAKTGDNKDLGWADAYVELLGGIYSGTQTNNGNVSETGYTANQANISADGLTVNLGPSGVGGKETWTFANTQDAQDFLDALKDDFGAGGDRRAIVNEVIEELADDLGGEQERNGNISESYEARQIKMYEKNGDVFVNMGSHKVGGKELYKFGSGEEATYNALEFVGEVRDLMGIEAKDGRVIDDMIYKVSGGAGISGSPTFVGKDAFVQYIAEEFGGTQTKNGSISESFGGGGRLVGDGSNVQLGPSGVGGKEIWDFDSEATATQFLATLNDIFG